MRVRTALLAATVALGAPPVSYSGWLVLSGNFHTVDAGHFYRSAQLDKDDLGEAIDDHHIRTVLNLRGPNPEQRWYQDELAATREHGAQHYDVQLSANEVVSPEKLKEILAILRGAPKPILVHCKSGADRTGLVSALYRYQFRREAAEKAEQELSLLYGHFPYLTSRSGAMDKTASDYFMSHPLTADF